MEKDVYELTSSQKNIWDTELFSTNSNINNVSGCFSINEKVDFDCLKEALNLYVQKNDGIRLKIKTKNGEPYQYVENYSPFNIEVVNLDNENQLKDFNYQICHTPFSVIDSNLFKFKMYRLPNGFGGFNVTFHHFISDAWTMSLFINQVAEFYAQLLNKKQISLDKYPSYVDYIVSQRNYITGSRFEKDSEFWNTLFNKEPELSYISHKNKTKTDTTAKRKTFTLDVNLYNKLIDFCKSANCSIYTFFMAIYSLYLAKINNTNSSIIGTPILNRSGFKEKQVAGMFISTVPFKVDVDRNISFSQFLKNVSNTQLSIFKHQKYPYDELLHNLKKRYNLTENLYDLVLSYQNAKDDKNNSEINYTTKWIDNGHILEPLEIHFYDMDDSGIFDIYYDYQINKFDEKEIDLIHSNILRMINDVLAYPEVSLADIKILSLEQEDFILNEINNTYSYYDKNNTLLKIFNNNVKKYPSNIALVFEDIKYTYKELDEKSNKLANYLDSLNIKKNTVIGIMLERSDATIISMLGILKANLAYMLIEKDLPDERIIYMLSNVNSPYLITSNKVKCIDFSNKIYFENIDFSTLNATALKNKEKPDDILSVVYTSGSTGTPKGILVKRNSLVNLVNGYRYSMKIDNYNNFLSICSVAFDMFTAEIWIALLSAKKLILANESQSKEPIYMSKLIEKEKCEFMLITSSKLDLLLSNQNTTSCLKYIKSIQLGGEVLNPKFYERLKDCTKAEIYNGYGPSETTSCCSCKLINSSSDITLGKPLINTQIYICNKDLNLCPIDVAGEICIAGDGVSFGYINNDEVTNKAFVKNPFGDGLLYKSGDIGKWNKNGEIEYIGRNDFQVKIRGLRVELEEINKALKSLPEIKNSIVLIKKIHNVDTICAYVVSSSNNMPKIQESLSASLPYYMVPSHIMFMEALPLNINGKIDIKNLPEFKVDLKYVKPVTQTEKKLAIIFEKFLNIEKISIDSDFFELGGDSLIAIKILTQINCDFNIDLKIKDIFANTSISKLANYIDSLTLSNDVIKLKKARNSDSYLATSAQKRIYYTVKANENSVVYNTPGGIIFSELPNLTKLESSINQLIKRHCSLRTYFTIENGELTQKIDNNIEFSLDIIEGSYDDLKILFKKFLKPFNLSSAPLFRTQFVKFENGKGILFIDFHHIICDGSSMFIILDELCKLYNDLTLDTLEFDYLDYSLWEQNYFDSNKFKEDENFWISNLSRELPVLDMPTTFQRPNIYSFEGNKINAKIADTEKIFNLCKKLNTTPFMFLLTAYYILLYKYTNQEDILVGTPIVGKALPEFSNMVGMFANTLVLRNSIDSNKSFSDMLSIVTKNCLNCFEHQTYPFDKLLEKLEITRNSNRNALFDTMFVYQNEGNPILNFNNINTKYYVPDNKTSKFDFLLNIIPTDYSFELILEYSTKLFSKNFMKKFLEHYINILKIILIDTNIKIKDINMLSSIELENYFSSIDKNTAKYPKDLSIIELFEKQVAKTSNSTAIIFGDEKLTYKQLKNKVIAFSNYLLKQGVKKGDIIGTLLDRSSNLIVAMLAIMKCGCVYLPISNKMPKERIEYISKNSKLKFIITTKSNKIKLDKDFIYADDVNYADLSNSINISYSPDDPIYCIYTSGSTGKPKGVVVTNKNLCNFIYSFKKLYDNSIDENDIFISTTNICFDVSIWEFFLSLLNGSKLYLYNNDTIEDIFDFCNTLIAKKITVAYLPPNILDEVYNILSESNQKIYLEKILVGVEPIKTSTISKYFLLNKKMKIVNGYGPTETTICCTAFKVKNNTSEKYNIIPIGKPLHNLKSYILDKDLCPVPTGVLGELYISGANVTAGYLNNSTLTKQKYINSPFDSTELMYSTGDVVKLLPDNNLMFVGRNDNQVKIKGHRIELSEISNTVLSYPSINKCYVLVKEKKDNKSICLFFTANKKVILNDLKSFLALKLPSYLMPNYYMQLDKFVLTSNGKIDKKYLNDIKLVDTETYEKPSTDFEKKLVALWEEFLNVEKIGINDNFFDLGGDSLIAIRMQIEAFKLGLNISYSDIFTYPTIKQLSNKIDISQSSINIRDYNYNNINLLLEKNKLPVEKSLKPIYYKNILLTGVTGFVGIHILDSLLSNTDATIYCLVRDRDNSSSAERLNKTLQFYFGNKYSNLINNRIRLVKGDISRPQLGLSDSDYKKLGRKISCIINSAAVVKHYGNSNVFDKVNINGVKSMVKFASSFNIKLYHLSTLSVSGNVFAEGSFDGSTISEQSDFKETDLFIGQDISNVYVYTKFMAERIILENISKNNLDACIIRLGNITNRYSDGKFQINVSENAFLNRILSFIKLGCIPDYLLNGYAEFTPVDYVATAITKIVHTKSDYTIFHLYNNKHLSMKKLIELLNDYGLKMDILPEKDFLNVVNTFLNSDKNALSGIINDFDTNKKLIYDSNIVLDNNFTNEFLAKLSFKWCSIGKEYLFKYLDYLKNLGYLEGK